MEEVKWEAGSQPRGPARAPARQGGAAPPGFLPGAWLPVCAGVSGVSCHPAGPQGVVWQSSLSMAPARCAGREQAKRGPSLFWGGSFSSAPTRKAPRRANTAAVGEPEQTWARAVGRGSAVVCWRPLPPCLSCFRHECRAPCSHSENQAGFVFGTAVGFRFSSHFIRRCEKQPENHAQFTLSLESQRLLPTYSLRIRVASFKCVLLITF